MKQENIMVFASNIKTKKDKKIIGKVFDNHEAISHWHVDQEDIDCVLRIVSPTLTENQIIKIVHSNNYICTELK